MNYIYNLATVAHANLATTTSSASDNLANQMTQKISGLFPAWPIILATTIAFLIILVVLTKLVYKPVKKMVKERHDFIQKNIDVSINKSKEANKFLDSASREIIKAQKEAEDIIEQARSVANLLKEESLQRVKEETKRMISDANKKIQHDKKLFETESKKEVVNIASEMALKIIKENNGELKDDNFVKKIIKEKDND